MRNPPAQGPCTFLMLRVTDTVRLRMRRQSALFQADCPPPPCFQLESGALTGAPELAQVCLTPARTGCCLDALLCLPVTLFLTHECSRCALTGAMQLPVQAMLRSPCAHPMHFVPHADLCVMDVQLQDGCLCVFFDLTLTLYAACLGPVQLSAAACCAPCASDCSPFFDLPLYPELPPSCC